MNLRAISLIFVMLVLSLSVLGGCNDNSSVFFDGDTESNDDDDEGGEIETGEIVDQPDGDEEACEEGERSCRDDSVALVCNDEGKWLFAETCFGDTVCVEGECVAPVDGDLAEDGDVDGGEDAEQEIVIDGDAEPAHCGVDLDCPYGFGCLPDGPGDGCIPMSECDTNEDCDPGFTCQQGTNWNVCRLRPDECARDTDCPWGFACMETAFGYRDCVEHHECRVDEDCPTGMICSEGPQWLICKPQSPPCRNNEDCDFGYYCDTSLEYPVCIFASTCESDADCDIMRVCKVVENWKECVWNTSPDICQSDADCGQGEYCEIVAAGYGSCRSLNQCKTNDDCPEYFECEFNGTYKECVETVPCRGDADCSFGYRCISASPRNYCEYANECGSDADCQRWEQCVRSENWMVCKVGGGGFCSSDDDCQADEYCDGLLGAFGSCVSRNQCSIDEDCGEGLVCQHNGTYYECVPADTQQCWFDFQCSNDWLCLDGTCRPKYEGMCTDVEGQWTAWMSDCTLITVGQVYEFIPEDGCNGRVDSVTLNIPVGSFAESSESNYTVTFAYVLECQASVNVGALMELDCGSCTAQLGSL